MLALRFLYLIVYALVSLFLFACESRSARSPDTVAVITVTDDLGRKIEIPKFPRRVMALAPSETEMLYAVADENTIVGRTQNCDYPVRVKKKPIVNNYPMDYEQLVLLKPDLVFTVEGMTSAEEAAKIQELHIPVYYQKFEKVTDVLRGLTDMGRLLQRQERAKTVVDSLQQALNQLQVRAAAKPKLSVLAVTWTDPIFVYGQNTIFTDKLRYIGSENAVREILPQPYPALTREYILKLNPDIIIGGTFGKMDTSFFKIYPELKQLKAYRNKKIFAATDNLMARPGPRVVASIQELKAFIW
jgi:iron complex transport system substrate-binding protein